MSPQGATFSQQKAETLATGDNDLILVCGHYEGFDERIRDYVDEEISIGDYVLTGGELAAATIVDAVARLIPGVLGKEESFQSESFSDSLLEYPQYTRPEEYEGKKVPEILKGGNHAEIEKWRQEKAKEKTKKRRPDLIR
jgi:tRNA (guanine37-N1)-methyltransferase